MSIISRPICTVFHTAGEAVGKTAFGTDSAVFHLIIFFYKSMETGAFPFLASGAGTELKAVRCSSSSKAGTAFENCRQYSRTDVKLRGDFLQRAGRDAAAVFGLDLA